MALAVTSVSRIQVTDDECIIRSEIAASESDQSKGQRAHLTLGQANDSRH